MSYQRMLDRVMQSGKRLLKEDPKDGGAHEEEAEVQDFISRPANNEGDREEFEDYVKHKVVSGKSIPKAAGTDRGGSKDDKSKVLLTKKRPGEKSPLNTSSRANISIKKEPALPISGAKSSTPSSKGLQTHQTIVNGMPLRSNPINQSSKNYGIATPASKRTNQQSARGSGVSSPRPAPHTPSRGMQTPKQDSPIASSAGGRKHLISVQEEFLKMHNRRTSTPNQKSPGQDSAISSKYSGKDGESNYLKSQIGGPASLQETLDIYKKYDFLKNGKVKITHKTAKFLTTRIKPADCVVYLLDSLFLLMGEHKLRLDAKIRFIEYKQSLSKVEVVNDHLQQLFLDFKANPDRYSNQVELASKSLDKFYTESAFSDLVTLDYCKEILWISQGLIRFHNKCREGASEEGTGFDERLASGAAQNKTTSVVVQSRTEEAIKAHNERLKLQQQLKKLPEATSPSAGSHHRSQSKPEGDEWNRLAAIPAEDSLEVEDQGRGHTEGLRKGKNTQERGIERVRRRTREGHSLHELGQPMAHFSYSMDPEYQGHSGDVSSISRGDGQPEQTQFSSSLRDRDPLKETGSSLADSRGPEPRRLTNHRYELEAEEEDVDEREYMSFGKGEVQGRSGDRVNSVSEMHRQKVREMLQRIQGSNEAEEEGEHAAEDDSAARGHSDRAHGGHPTSPDNAQIRFYDRNTQFPPKITPFPSELHSRSLV